MRILQTIFLLIVIPCFVFSQDKIQKKAFQNAREMSGFYKQRDIKKYVDFLLPAHYGNDTINKVRFSQMLESALKRDTSTYNLSNILKFSKSESQYQVLFEGEYRERKTFVIGVSDNQGNDWYFTQPFSEKMKFSQLLKYIPLLDHSFADILDPKFGNRITYEVGKSVLPFMYTDINGNKLSSNDLKDRVIVLNFWLLACKPCIMEIPELNKLVEKYNGDNICFIAPTMNTTEEELVNQILSKQPFSYNIVIGDSNDYEISAFPTHVVLNKKHEVVEIITGYSKENIQKLDITIENCLRK